MRRPEGNPLDLNNLPDEYSRDGKQVVDEDTSSPGCRRKKSGNKEECGKVYECRFCSLKFCKSQALGGHMNRHRQERETETLNQARQLVFRNDHTLPAPHLGCCPPPPPPPPIAGDPMVGMRFPRYFSAGSSSTTHIGTAPPQSYLYGGASASRPPFPSHFPHHDYYVGHVMGNYVGVGESSSYTCIGAPVVGGGGRGMEVIGKEGSSSSSGHVHVAEEGGGLNWGGRINNNRFQDHGF